MTKKMAFVKVLSVTFVAVGAVVIASFGMPRASGDPPIDTGGGSGGGGPPGGVADAPGGVSNDDGLWSATVGGTEFSGLGASDVGKLLWRGQKVSTTILGDDGVPRTVQVCEDFPQITLASSASNVTPGGSTAVVDLDFRNCIVSVSSLTHTTTGATDPRVPSSQGPQALLWNNEFEATSRPISWVQTQEESVTQIRPAPPRMRQSTLTMQLVAADGAAAMLTEVYLYSQYAIESLNPLGFHKNCDADSPATLLGVQIVWHEDRCTGGQSVRFGRVASWARGEFHGEATRGASFSRSSRHSLNVGLQGYRNGEARNCTANPRSISSLRGRYGPINLGVKLRCSYNTGIR